VAVALARPVHINTNDCDIAMICEEDFLDDDEGYAAEYGPDPVHVQFSIQHVSLCHMEQYRLELGEFDELRLQSSSLHRAYFKGVAK
jgi:hypothetical protein